MSTIANGSKPVRSGVRLLTTVSLDDFVAGGEPYLLVRGNVFERAIEIADAMRHADQERMQREPHHPAAARQGPAGPSVRVGGIATIERTTVLPRL